jgi:hypothetical protein
VRSRAQCPHSSNECGKTAACWHLPNMPTFWNARFENQRAPEVGLEPTTNRLTADRSTTELLRNVAGWRVNHTVDGESILLRASRYVKRELVVQSTNEMVWIDFKAFGFPLPRGTDELKRSEACESFAHARVGVGRIGQKWTLTGVLPTTYRSGRFIFTTFETTIGACGCEAHVTGTLGYDPRTEFHLHTSEPGR